MPAIVQKQEVITKVKTEVVWWVRNRMKKLQNQRHDTMSLNPFLAPILYDLHHSENFAELGELLLAGHLMNGHSTGFGKLIDERILPKVFRTHKLSGRYRDNNPPLNESYFNEIDHEVKHLTDKPILLSMKTSRWTIQLTAAIELNNAFVKILQHHVDRFDKIVVGVSVGNLASLGDKYDILRGINRGRNHDVINIQQHVQVLAGQAFWSWINGGENLTQDWVMDGIVEGLEDANCREEGRLLLNSFKQAYNRLYDRFRKEDGKIDWHALLKSINT